MREGILILGGGFIGAALANRLATLGAEVHMICHHSPNHPINSKVDIHVGELDNLLLLGKFRHTCRTVVHVASSTTPGSSSRNPTREFKNLSPLLHLLEYLQDWEDIHFVFLSSGGTVYGNPLGNPVLETTPLAPISYYGAGKVAAESLLHAFSATGKLTTILRPSNVYGPLQPLQPGFGLIRNFLEHARNKTTAEIWGDGTSIRDFIFIDDVVEACIRFIQLQQDSDIYNLGGGIGYSINQVLHQIQSISPYPLTVSYRQTRKTDVREIVLDISKIKTRLSWHPQVCLEEGLQRTMDWLSKS